MGLTAFALEVVASLKVFMCLEKKAYRKFIKGVWWFVTTNPK